jgi:hypothetical protein
MLSISTGNCGNQFACQTLSAIVEKGVAQMADDLKNRGAEDRSREVVPIPWTGIRVS